MPQLISNKSIANIKLIVFCIFSLFCVLTYVYFLFLYFGDKNSFKPFFKGKTTEQKALGEAENF
jgi:hypothetical protein